MNLNFFKHKFYFILLAFFIFSILPLFFKLESKSITKNFPNEELFDSSLVRLNSIDKIIKYNDSLYYRENNAGMFDTLAYVKIVTNTIKNRFYHGISYYAFKDNWISYIAGKVLWAHFLAIVEPNDILKHPQALCSQQAIVYMEVLKEKKINVRSVGLGYKEGPGHFLNEVHYNGSWHLYDVTKEPKWKLITNHHRSMEYYLSNKDSLYVVYNNSISKTDMKKLLERVVYGKANDFPAKNMIIFHRFTLILTYILPIFLFLFIVFHTWKLLVSKAEEDNYSIKSKNRL